MMTWKLLYTPTWMKIGIYIKNNPDTYTLKIQKELEIAWSTCNYIIKDMEKHGIITKKTMKGNKRTKTLKIKKGHKRLFTEIEKLNLKRRNETKWKNK